MMSGYYMHKLKQPNAKKKKVIKAKHVYPVIRILYKQFEFSKYLKKSTRKTYLTTITNFLEWFQ